MPGQQTHFFGNHLHGVKVKMVLIGSGRTGHLAIHAWGLPIIVYRSYISSCVKDNVSVSSIDCDGECPHSHSRLWCFLFPTMISANRGKEIFFSCLSVVPVAIPPPIKHLWNKLFSVCPFDNNIRRGNKPEIKNDLGRIQRSYHQFICDRWYPALYYETSIYRRALLITVNISAHNQYDSDTIIQVCVL